MPSASFRYKGYTIRVSDLLGPEEVTYQSPFWPSDPRIVKAPSVDTAKRWIREECRRVAWYPGSIWFLKKLAPRAYQIVDKAGIRLIPAYSKISDFETPQAARDYAESQDFALFEHFNY